MDLHGIITVVLLTVFSLGLTFELTNIGQEGKDLRTRRNYFKKKTISSKFKPRSITSRIIGGKNSDPGMIPSIVSLKNKLKMHGCGGTLLRKDIVLTAAHCCLADQNGLGIEWAQAGGSHTSHLKQNRKIVKLVIHPKYNRTKTPNGEPQAQGHDLCILKIIPDFNLKEKENYFRVRLATRNEKDVPKNTSLIVAGWGKTSNTPGAPSDPELKYLKITAINDTECRNRLNFIYEHQRFRRNLTHLLVKENICTTQEENTDSCQGDSGGPLFLEEGKKKGPWTTLVGVVSWGPDCAVKDAPAIYVDVSEYKNWIDETMKTL